LDIGAHGLGLALRDADGQIAAVHLERWQPLDPVGPVRGFSRARLTDGSLTDTTAISEAADRGQEQEVIVEDLGGGATRVTIRTNGGAEAGGTTQVLEDDGQGKNTDLFIEADGTQTFTVRRGAEDGGVTFSRTITRPDGTRSETTGSVSSDGLENSMTTHFVNGNPSGTSSTSEFHQGTDVVRQTLTTGPDGSTTTHAVTSHGDGTTSTVDTVTDSTGQVTGQVQQLEWPNGHVTSVLNPDGTTTHTTTTHHSQPDGLGILDEVTDTVTVHTTDSSGHQVGDTHTTTTRTHEVSGTRTLVETTHHPDGSKHIHTTEFDPNGQVSSEQDEFQPPPDAEVLPPDTRTDGGGVGGTGTSGPSGPAGPGGPGAPGGPAGPAGPGGPGGLGGLGPGITTGPDGPPTQPPGGTLGGVDITGEPCDPVNDPGCLPVVKKAKGDRAGPVSAEIGELQDLIEALSSTGDANAVAAAVFELAPAIFDLPRPATRGLSRRGARLVIERDVPGDDDAWSNLEDPRQLVRSLQDMSAYARR
jgi:hypothetical protein